MFAPAHTGHLVVIQSRGWNGCNFPIEANALYSAYSRSHDLQDTVLLRPRPWQHITRRLSTITCTCVKVQWIEHWTSLTPDIVTPAGKAEGDADRDWPHPARHQCPRAWSPTTHPRRSAATTAKGRCSPPTTNSRAFPAVQSPSSPAVRRTKVAVMPHQYQIRQAWVPAMPPALWDRDTRTEARRRRWSKRTT
nr:hypothetical protein CFP56_13085 [Quercus suber]